MTSLRKIHQQVIDDPDNAWAGEKGWTPLYTAHKDAKVIIIGQAPGRLAQESGVPWDDPSGRNLRSWMGVSDEVFYDETKIALLPMDFYFPGSAARGDVPPRISQADKWHKPILAHMKQARLTLLIGGYSQNYYLGKTKKKALTETVRSYDSYGPNLMPLVHPSPRNNIWQKKNPWFVRDLLPALKNRISKALYDS